MGRDSKSNPVIQIYRGADFLIGALIIFVSVFSPWFFGSTQEWAIILMSSCGVAVGLLGFGKKLLRRFAEPLDDSRATNNRPHISLWWVFALLNILLLAWCITAILNARATFDFDQLSFIYLQANPSLPTTYDRRSSVIILVMVVGYSGIFWGLRDWLAEPPRRRHKSPELVGSPPQIPRRLIVLLGVLAANGALLGLQGILQRLSGSGNLLWIEPSWYKTADACFGPFSYRGNAASCLNLLWPLGVGLILILLEKRIQSGERLSEGPHLLLVVAVVVTACAVVATLSRAGGIICAIQMLVVWGFLLHKWRHRRTALLASLLAVAVIAIGTWVVAGPKLVERFKDMDEQLGGRKEIYENAAKMVADFPYLGTGPGSFTVMYYLYRDGAKKQWHSVAHNDWLETRVTFGLVGSFIFYFILLFLFFKPFHGSGVELPSQLIFLFYVAAGGCLLNAAIDFPFQIYSIALIFVVLVSIISATRIKLAA